MAADDNLPTSSPSLNLWRVITENGRTDDFTRNARGNWLPDAADSKTQQQRKLFLYEASEPMENCLSCSVLITTTKGQINLKDIRGGLNSNTVGWALVFYAIDPGSAAPHMVPLNSARSDWCLSES